MVSLTWKPAWSAPIAMRGLEGALITCASLVILSVHPTLFNAPLPAGRRIWFSGARSSTLQPQRCGVPRLVQPEFTAARNLDCRRQAKARFGDRPRKLHSLALQLFDRGFDVVAHEVELLMALLLGGVDAQLGGRQCEDEPAMPGINARELEHIAEESAQPVRILGIDQRMHAMDHAPPPRAS